MYVSNEAAFILPCDCASILLNVDDGSMYVSNEAAFIMCELVCVCSTTRVTSIFIECRQNGSMYVSNEAACSLPCVTVRYISEV
jgi:hypothetical protein